MSLIKEGWSCQIPNQSDSQLLFLLNHHRQGLLMQIDNDTLLTTQRKINHESLTAFFGDDLVLLYLREEIMVFSDMSANDFTIKSGEILASKEIKSKPVQHLINIDVPENVAELQQEIFLKLK